MMLSTRQKLLLACIGLSLLTSLTVGGSFYLRFNESLVQRQMRSLERETELLTQSWTDFRSDSERQLLVLANLPPLRALGALGDSETMTFEGANREVWRMRLAEIYLETLRSRPLYEQVRFIGTDGVEVARVEQRGGAARILAPAELQDKGDRTYFQAGLATPVGQVHSAPVDFNQEHGRLVYPLSSMLRLVTAVASEAGEVMGVVVVNIPARPVLRYVFGRTPGSDAYVVNHDGDYVLHADPLRELGSLRGSSDRLQHTFPALASWLTSESPATTALTTRNGRQEVMTLRRLGTPPESALTFILATPLEDVLADSVAARNESLAWGALWLILACGVAWVIASRLSRPIREMTQWVENAESGQHSPLLAGDPGSEFRALAMAFQKQWQRVGEHTAALQAEVAQRRLAETTMTTLIEASPLALLISCKKGDILMANPAAADLLGCSSKQLLGSSVHEFVPDEARAEHRISHSNYMKAPVARGMAGGRALRAKRADDRHVAVEVLLTPVELPSGPAILSTLIDLTERKRNEQRLEQALSETEFANDELKSFAYSVAHDLRGPLRAIHGFSQALLEDCAESIGADGQHFLKRIGAAAENMAQMIDGLLALSGLSSKPLMREALDISRLADELVEGLRQKDERNTRLDIEQNLQAHADGRLVRSLLSNLLENAFKYSAKQSQPAVAVGSRLTPHGAAFFVRDNGVGFDQQYAEKLFQPFCRLHSDEEYSGTGIGLATAERVVRMHGGRIWAESKPGHGAVLYFTLDKATSSSAFPELLTSDAGAETGGANT